MYVNYRQPKPTKNRWTSLVPIIQWCNASIPIRFDNINRPQTFDTFEKWTLADVVMSQIIQWFLQYSSC